MNNKELYEGLWRSWDNFGEAIKAKNSKVIHDLYSGLKNGFEIQKLNEPNKNLKIYHQASKNYEKNEAVKRQLELGDPWCCSVATSGYSGIYQFQREWFNLSFPAMQRSGKSLSPYLLFYHDMINYYEYYFIDSKNDTLIERLHKNNRRSIMNSIIKRMEEISKL